MREDSNKELNDAKSLVQMYKKENDWNIVKLQRFDKLKKDYALFEKFLDTQKELKAAREQIANLEKQNEECKKFKDGLKSFLYLPLLY